MVKHIPRYIVSQTLTWISVTLLGTILIFFTTQLVRIAPQIFSHGGSISQTAQVIGLLIVPVLGWALTPALAVALFATGGRMARDGELILLDAAGFSRRSIVLGPLILALFITLLSSWIWLDAAPRSQRILRELAVDMVSASLINQITPGEFYDQIPGVTFLVDGIAPNRALKGVFIETIEINGQTRQFVAQTAKLTLLNRCLVIKLHLKNGTAFADVQGTKTALSFETLELTLPIIDEIEKRLDFLPKTQGATLDQLNEAPPPGISAVRWQFALWRKIAGPLGTLIVSIVSIFLAFTTNWRSRFTAVGFATLVFLAFHILGRLSETLMDAGELSAPVAALLPSIFAAFFGVLIVILTQWTRQGKPPDSDGLS